MTRRGRRFLCLFRGGLGYYRKGEFDRAIKQFKEALTIYTDDKRQLLEAVSKSSERPSATDLVMRAADRSTRPTRKIRPMRDTRLSPVQRVANLIENAWRWFGGGLGPEVLQPASAFRKPTRDLKPPGETTHSRGFGI